MNEQDHKSVKTIDLLAELNTPAAGVAWQQFLDTYSASIMQIAGQFYEHPERRNDCFLFVCEKLCDNDFARLRRYQPEGSARFSSWLKVVVANLCIDKLRRDRGRDRPFRAIRRLPPLEQSVFRYRFQSRMNSATCLELLKSHFPGLTAEQLALATKNVNQALSSRQHWLLSTTRPRFESQVQRLPDQGPDPEQKAFDHEAKVRLEQALSQLQPSQSLLLKLRYQQDLSFREIARLTRLGDPFKARYAVQKALRELQTILKD